MALAAWLSCPPGMLRPPSIGFINVATKLCSADRQKLPERPVLQFEPSPSTTAGTEDDLLAQVDDLFDSGSGENHQLQPPSTLGLRGTSAEESRELSSTPR